MKIYESKELRNVSLLGGAHSGKTTLAEAIAFLGGKITRRGTIEDRNTVSDYREIEMERKSSVYLAPVFAEYNNHKVNAIDTPGFDDFQGEVISAMYVTDASLVLLNAQHGIEVGTELIWRQVLKCHMPAVLIVNQLDSEKANYEETLLQAKKQFGKKVAVVQYPVNQGVGFDSVIDVIKMKMLKFDENGHYQETEIPEQEKEKAAEYQNLLIEAAAENDDSLMELFFEKGTLSEDEVRKGLKVGIIKNSIYPVLCISAKKNYGTGRMLEFITRNIPSPCEGHMMEYVGGEKIKFQKEDKEQLFVFKTNIEPHLGEISIFKVTAGVVKEGVDLVNINTGSKERLTQLYLINGKNREKIDQVVAGDIAAAIKLKDTHTCNTLNSLKGEGIQVMPIKYPQPRHRVAVKLKETAEEEKMGIVLKQLQQEDPTLIVEGSVELKQTILSGQGELHLNIIKWILEKQHKLQLEYISPKIPYRETITKSAKAMYRHKKQSGGAGQFGEVHLMIQPYTEGMEPQKEFTIRGTEEIKLNWGGKLVFNNCIVGGAIDARFLPAILKGVMEKMEEGPLTGSYARDIVVSVYDGKMHPVDSNELSFKLAGRNAFKEAFKCAGPKIMEPVYDLEVYVPEERMGDVMTDLQGRRAVIMGMEGEGVYQRIKAKVPLAEMNRYSTSLSSLTSGRATFGMKFDEYQQVPTDVQEILLKEYEKHMVEEE